MGLNTSPLPQRVIPDFASECCFLSLLLYLLRVRNKYIAMPTVIMNITSSLIIASCHYPEAIRDLA
jgi:hypothetical protein